MTAPHGPTSFHLFEHAGWERATTHYGDAFGGLTQQTIAPLLDAALVTHGTRVLDVASGPGYVAAAAAKRGATVVGLDFSAAMVADAERRYPALTFREGDADALPFEADRFDAVVMNFGLLHLARPDTAITEAHRVLRAGGRFAFTVWAEPVRAVGFGIILKAVEKFGRMDVALPEGPPFFRFSAADESRRTLEHAGFTDVDVQRLPLTWRLLSAEALFEAFSHGAVRTAALLRAQSPDALVAIRAETVRAVKEYKDGSGFSIPNPAVLASTRKP